MDDNRIEGVAREGAGRVEDAWGGLTGDTATQAKGKWREAQGVAQKLYGEAREQLRDSMVDRTRQAREGFERTVDLIENRPLAALGVAAFVGLTLGLLVNSGRSSRVVYVKR